MIGRAIGMCRVCSRPIHEVPHQGPLAKPPCPMPRACSPMCASNLYREENPAEFTDAPVPGSTTEEPS